MSRRTQGILVGTLVAALAAGLWLATREERPDAGPLRPDPGSRLETPRRDPTPQAPSGIATSTFEARPDLEVAAPPVSGQDFIIEVVAAGTGAPVPGARVRLFDLNEMLSADLDRLRSEEFKDGRFLLERGHRDLTGADGRVRAHRFPRRALVQAAKGALWTRRHLARIAIPLPAGDLGELIRRLRGEDH